MIQTIHLYCWTCLWNKLIKSSLRWCKWNFLHYLLPISKKAGPTLTKNSSTPKFIENSGTWRPKANHYHYQYHYQDSWYPKANCWYINTSGRAFKEIDQFFITLMQMKFFSLFVPYLQNNWTNFDQKLISTSTCQ